MLMGMQDSHSQLDSKALTDIERSGAARQGIAHCPLALERRNMTPISDLLISVLTQHQTMYSACKFWTSTGVLQQPRLPWPSVHASQANQSDCQCATVMNSPHHNLTGCHIKLKVFAKSNGQQADSGYGTCNIPRLERWGKDRAACTGWSDTNSHCGDMKLISKDRPM